MSPLATAVYKVLRQKLASSKATSITYGELAKRVSRRVPTHHRSSKLHEALGEITNACRSNQLPAIPAIVWLKDSRRPSDGYFAVAHPRAKTEDSQQLAWEAEHERVVRGKGKFPATLE